MSRSFKLDDGGDNDTVLTVMLLLVAVGLSLVTFHFFLPGFTFSIGPLVAFLVTRFAYKWHFRRMLQDQAPRG